MTIDVVYFDQRGSCKTHEEKQRKNFVGQPLGVSPKSWLTPKGWLLIWNYFTLDDCITSILNFHNIVFQKTFCVMHMRRPCKKRTKNNKIPNEQPAFGCQPAFGSHSQSLTNKLFSSFFFMSLI